MIKRLNRCPDHPKPFFHLPPTTVKGESVTLPVMDTRQRMYLMSIIKKAMDDCYAPSGMVVPDSSEEKEDKKEDMKVNNRQ